MCMAWKVAGLVLLLGGLALGQCEEQVLVDDDFTEDPTLNGWVLNGNAQWDPGLEAVILTQSAGSQAGTMFYDELLPINNFRIEATVEIGDPENPTGTGADGMTITLIGGEDPTLIGAGGGGMAATNLPGPQIIIEFDIWGNESPPDAEGGGNGTPGANHVGVEYSPDGFFVGDQLPSDAWARLDFIDPMENAGPIDIVVQVQDALVTVDVKKATDENYRRIITHEFDDYDEFDGLIGATASTGGAWERQVVHRLKITALPENLCLMPPATITRTIETPSAEVRQGTAFPVYEDGTELDVSVALSEIREADPPRCTEPTELRITETLPAGWTASDIGGGGAFADGKITWTLSGAALEPTTLTYKATAAGTDVAVFSGEMLETNAECAQPFQIQGDAKVYPPGGLAFTGQGFIRDWLILGPYDNPGGANPMVIDMEEDYLTDGNVDEFTVEPYPGYQIDTDFGGFAFSTQLIPAPDPSLNPGGIPTWFAWYDLDDTIAFEDTFGAGLDNIMAYAFTYVKNETGADLDVDIGLGSDDSIQVLLNGDPIWTNSVARGSGGANTIQDVVAGQTLYQGLNTVLVKVFEGGGAHNFRLRFQEPDGTPITEGLRIQLHPEGCFDPPAEVVRTIAGGDAINLEGIPTPIYAAGDEFDVTLEIVSIREAGDECQAPTEVTITEIPPAGWTVSDATGGGVLEGGRITWTLSGAGLAPGTVTYKLRAAGDEPSVYIGSEIREEGSDLVFAVSGTSRLVTEPSPFTDTGFIRSWLILGPYGNPGGDDPGIDVIQDDWLTDGTIDEMTLEIDDRCWPQEGDQIDTDYTLAASSGLSPNGTGKNPDGIPEWFAWWDEDDTIDFTAIFGDLTNVMAYAVCYVEAEEDMDVDLCIGSDDSVVVAVNDEPPVWANSIPRGWGAAEECQDLVPNVPLLAGRNRILVKVFEGGGAHGFRLAILEAGVPVPAEGITVTLDCGGGPVEEAVFLRGDFDVSGNLTIGDAISLLNYMFAGGTPPKCPDAADVDDNGNYTIGDAISLLNYMFGGGGPPADPGATTCGRDPSPDSWGPETCLYDAGKCP